MTSYIAVGYCWAIDNDDDDECMASEGYDECMAPEGYDECMALEGYDECMAPEGCGRLREVTAALYRYRPRGHQAEDQMDSKV